MSKNINLKSLFKNGILFIALIGVTFYIIFKDNNINDIFIALKSVNLLYILIAILSMVLFICCEAINTRRMLNFFSHNVSFIDAIKYSFIGFFFTSVTPAGSGGYIMQVYYMDKDNIDISHSALTMLVELASFQFTTIVVAVISFFINYNFISSADLLVKILIWGGVAFNTLILIVLLIAIFLNDLTLRIANALLKFLGKFKFIKVEKFKDIVYKQIHEYQEGAKFIKGNKAIVVKTIITSLFQICFMYSITYWVYRAFNLSKLSFIFIISLQALLSIAASAVPLPGGVGVSESEFLKLFKTIFPSNILSSAMILSRGISFYLFVIIGSIVVIIAQISVAKSKTKDL